MKTIKKLHSSLQPTELRLAALYWLSVVDATQKSIGVRLLQKSWADAQITLEPHTALEAHAPIPGQPSKPELVPPRLVARRSMRTEEGRAAMIHALAHIEFNAINLALDAIWRFPNMPHQYYADWLKVAAEESLHFSLLANHLKRIGHVYGDFTAHNSLWEMAEKTKSDILARMALVPRTLEARGLDAAPPMRAKLAQVGDLEAAAILDIILRDEIGHVAIGNHWYGYLCQQRHLEPIATYAELSKQYEAPKLRGPFNLEARKEAGFSDKELEALE